MQRRNSCWLEDLDCHQHCSNSQLMIVWMKNIRKHYGLCVGSSIGMLLTDPTTDFGMQRKFSCVLTIECSSKFKSRIENRRKRKGNRISEQALSNTNFILLFLFCFLFLFFFIIHNIKSFGKTFWTVILFKLLLIVSNEDYAPVSMENKIVSHIISSQNSGI